MSLLLHTRKARAHWNSASGNRRRKTLLRFASVVGFSQESLAEQHLAHGRRARSLALSQVWWPMKVVERLTAVTTPRALLVTAQQNSLSAIRVLTCLGTVRTSLLFTEQSSRSVSTVALQDTLSPQLTHCPVLSGVVLRGTVSAHPNTAPPHQICIVPRRAITGGTSNGLSDARGDLPVYSSLRTRNDKALALIRWGWNLAAQRNLSSQSGREEVRLLRTQDESLYEIRMCTRRRREKKQWAQTSAPPIGTVQVQKSVPVPICTAESCSLRCEPAIHAKDRCQFRFRLNAA